jgi:hypothetical protein
MSTRGQLPGGDDPDEAPWWPADGPWGGHGRRSVLLVVGGIVVVLAVVLVVTLLSGLGGTGSDEGQVAAGPPPPVLASTGLQPTTPVVVNGVPYDVGVGPFAPSARAATAGSHLLLAPLVVRNTGSSDVPNPLASPTGLLVAVGLRGLPPAVLSGPSALLCRNAAPESPLAPASPVFPGLEPGACVLDGRAAPSGAAAPSLGPGEQAQGILLSSPVPDVVTTTTPSVWVATTPGPPPRYARVAG